MFVKRSITWDAFERDWCPTCVKKVAMNPIVTGLPGIAAQWCPECKNSYQANYLEDGEDLLEVSDDLRFEADDPNQVALKIAYAKGELERRYVTKIEAVSAVEDLALEFEDQEPFFIYKMKLGLTKGEFTLDELASAFKAMIGFVIERSEPADDEDERS